MRISGKLLATLSPRKTLHRPAVVLAGLLALSVPMSADLLVNGCGSVTVIEGQRDLIHCVVQNLGNEAGGVYISGVFAYMEQSGPDFYDAAFSVEGVGTQVGTVINPMGNVDFKFFFTTDHADVGETPDFGLNVFSVILDAQDLSGNFIPGHYLGGIVIVKDDSTVNVTTTIGPPTIIINSRPEYMKVAGMAKSRGLVNSDMPEPSTLPLLGIGLLGIGYCVKRKRNVLS